LAGGGRTRSCKPPATNRASSHPARNSPQQAPPQCHYTTPQQPPANSPHCHSCLLEQTCQLLLLHHFHYQPLNLSQHNISDITAEQQAATSHSPNKLQAGRHHTDCQVSKLHRSILLLLLCLLWWTTTLSFLHTIVSALRALESSSRADPPPRTQHPAPEQ
jgi:hypothetical protein